MINALFNGIFSLVIGLVSVILTPIDLVIEKLLPDVAYGLNSFNAAIDYVSEYFEWAVSWTFLHPEVLSFIVVTLTYHYTAPYVVSTIKLAIKWFEKLKL